ncbi:unnamed protein product [Symbiodinium necroappetens]|uniref:Uncharacterized protein n=1 Tax=Symbiodinium necroappetens TaxID=1628268 RepID=A0A813BK22_9DINO|nr:unnamed protein product [Symbiodinium necroappetens]
MGLCQDGWPDRHADQPLADSQNRIERQIPTFINMGAAANRCCASERDRGQRGQEADRRVRFDGEDAQMTSSEKVQVLRRASRSDRASTAAASRPPDPAPGSQASTEAAQASQGDDSRARAEGWTRVRAPVDEVMQVLCEVGAGAWWGMGAQAEARTSAARQKGARLLKAGIKTGEVSKLVDAKEAEEAAKTGATTATGEEENLYEF